METGGQGCLSSCCHFQHGPQGPETSNYKPSLPGVFVLRKVYLSGKEDRTYFI